MQSYSEVPTYLYMNLPLTFSKSIESYNYFYNMYRYEEQKPLNHILSYFLPNRTKIQLYTHRSRDILDLCLHVSTWILCPTKCTNVITIRQIHSVRPDEIRIKINIFMFFVTFHYFFSMSFNIFCSQFSFNAI